MALIYYPGIHVSTPVLCQDCYPIPVKQTSISCFSIRISFTDPNFLFSLKFQSISLTISLKICPLFLLLSWNTLIITLTENQRAHTSFFLFLWLKEKCMMSLKETERCRKLFRTVDRFPKHFHKLKTDAPLFEFPKISQFSINLADSGRGPVSAHGRQTRSIKATNCHLFLTRV